MKAMSVGEFKAQFFLSRDGLMKEYRPHGWWLIE